MGYRQLRIVHVAAVHVAVVHCACANVAVVHCACARTWQEAKNIIALWNVDGTVSSRSVRAYVSVNVHTRTHARSRGLCSCQSDLPDTFERSRLTAGTHIAMRAHMSRKGALRLIMTASAVATAVRYTVLHVHQVC